MSKPKETKEPKRKPKYGMFSCVGYVYRLLWTSERSLAFVGILTVPISLALSALGLFTPSAILRKLETSERFSYIALVILGLLLADLLLNLPQNFIRTKTKYSEHRFLLLLQYMEDKKERNEDWYLSFEPEIEKIMDRASRVLESNHSGGAHFPMDFANLLSKALNFFLFGSVISLLHPAIILLLAAGSAVNHAVGSWERNRNWQERERLDSIYKKLKYLINETRSFQYAKDIRLYHMQEGLRERWKAQLASYRGQKEIRERRSFFRAFVSFAIVLLRDGAAYLFLIYKAVQGEIDAASFVLYFSAITSMSGLMGQIMGTINKVQEGAMQISDYRELFDHTGRLNRGKGIPVPTAPFSIEFRDVSFRYPKGEKKVLDHISFKIEAGEKVALVGLNGEGKTTLTKMMCGLFLPDEGEILLNGHSLFEYNRDEMYSLFGYVPQDFHLLPLSIARNVACAWTEEEIDREKLARCLETAGLTEKIASLPLGADTPLNKQVNPDGVELSGGETQKLLLARLLYKNPLCIVLDEPTAALDPIAEDGMYRHYQQISSHATSVFISHRLASTRFCQRIFLLEGGRFTEIGSHEELMAAGGKYRELFELQSKYYKEGTESGVML